MNEQAQNNNEQLLNRMMEQSDQMMEQKVSQIIVQILSILVPLQRAFNFCYDIASIAIIYIETSKLSVFICDYLKVDN